MFMLYIKQNCAKFTIKAVNYVAGRNIWTVLTTTL